MQTKLYLRTINEQGYGEAVQGDAMPISQLDDAKELHKLYKLHIASLPIFALVHPDYASRIGVGQWFSDWEEGYECSVDPYKVTPNWVSCSAAEFKSNEYPVGYKRKVLIQQSEPQTQEGDEKKRKNILMASREYVQLPSHKKINLWRKLGYEGKFDSGDKPFFEWLRSNDKVDSFCRALLIPFVEEPAKAPSVTPVGASEIISAMERHISLLKTYIETAFREGYARRNSNNYRHEWEEFKKTYGKEYDY